MLLLDIVVYVIDIVSVVVVVVVVVVLNNNIFVLPRMLREIKSSH